MQTPPFLLLLLIFSLIMNVSGRDRQWFCFILISSSFWGWRLFPRRWIKTGGWQQRWLNNETFARWLCWIYTVDSICCGEVQSCAHALSFPWVTDCRQWHQNIFSFLRPLRSLLTFNAWRTVISFFQNCDVMANVCLIQAWQQNSKKIWWWWRSVDIHNSQTYWQKHP